MSNERKLRLIQVAKEFKVGLNTITDFLQKKGIKTDGSPNTLVEPDVYAVLEKEFGGSRITGNERESIRERISQKQATITLEEAQKQTREEEQEVIIKSNVISVKDETAPAQNSGQNRSFAQAQTGSETGKQTRRPEARNRRLRLRNRSRHRNRPPPNGSGTCLRNGFRSQTRTGSGAQERQHLPPRRADPHGPAGTRHDGRIGIHTGQPPQTQTPE